MQHMYLLKNQANFLKPGSAHLATKCTQWLGLQYHSLQLSHNPARTTLPDASTAVVHAARLQLIPINHNGVDYFTSTLPLVAVQLGLANSACMHITTCAACC
jgi:hypothetical protein